MSDTNLSDLQFIDLYLRLDSDDSPLFRPKERSQNRFNQFVPEAFLPAVKRFGEAIKNSMTESDGSINFEGVRCRLSRQKMADDSVWVCARNINTVIPDINKLGFAPHVAEHMHSLGTREGLILISGATGQGKTTTAVAMLADFLRSYGGAAITIEDPVEYTLKGRYGDNGQCFQIEVKNDDEWALFLKRALRWAPRYIYVGEIRTPKAAEQLLRAATTGHTVITTVHAGAPEEALMGLLFLAEQAVGPGASTMLAASLSALIYQTMRGAAPFVRYLFTEENAPGDPIRGLIRENKIGMISTYIDRISARLSTAAGSPAMAPPAPPLSSLPPIKK